MSPIITTTTEATPPLLVVEPEGVEVAIISVYDNYQVEPGLRTAWGFACVVRTPEEQILFDTGGNSEILLFNMRMMNIDPGAISKVVISHIHGDHIGGLEGFLEEALLDQMSRLRENRFLKRWLKVHDEELGARDELVGLVGLLASHEALQWLGRRLFNLDRILRLLQALRRGDGDPYLEAARREAAERGMRYVIMGHTHVPRMEILNADGALYLNCGTWRRRIHRAWDGSFGFIRHITYLLVYAPEEHHRRFELWQGLQAG